MKHQARALVITLGLTAANCANERPEFSKTNPNATGSSLNANLSGPYDSGMSDFGTAGSSGYSGQETFGTGAGSGTHPSAVSSAGQVGVTGGLGNDDTSSSTQLGTGPGETSTASGGNTATSSERSTKALGDSCSTANECQSGFCADGVCCATACNGVCAQCDLDGSVGTCSAPDNDPTCPELACKDSTDCRSYELVSGTQCHDVGQCATSADCSTSDAPINTPCQDGAGTCNGSGECIVPNTSALGEACSANADCGSGFCADTSDGGKVCCDSACDEPCQACDDDGSCAAVQDDDACATITCNQDTVCADYPGPLTTNRCAAGQCIEQADYCTPTFAGATQSCGTGAFCDGSGACEDACDTGEDWCTDACFDLQSDDDNCGECGQSCPDTSSCEGGTCTCPGASEEICDDVCVDLDSDVKNCGMCERECDQPAESGSTAACLNGACGGCGAYGQSCCGTTCSGGLACSNGTCGCPSNTHRCSTGAAAGTCAANDDETACGNSCEDCSQSNAVAQCTVGTCDNVCLTGVTELCAGSNGRPSCGSWDFEDGTQTWQIDITLSGNAGSPTQSGSIGADGTAKSLAIPYSDLNGNLSGVLFRVALCDTVSLAGKSVSFKLRFQNGTGSPNPAGNGFVTLLNGSTSAGSLSQLTDFQTTSWVTFDQDLDSGFILNPDATLSVTHIGITLLLSGWAGTIYVDEFRIMD